MGLKSTRSYVLYISKPSFRDELKMYSKKEMLQNEIQTNKMMDLYLFQSRILLLLLVGRLVGRSVGGTVGQSVGRLVGRKV